MGLGAFDLHQESQSGGCVQGELPNVESRGKYRLISRIASGGMGNVFLARQEGPAGFVTMVVIKCILDHLASDEHFVQMFLDEARLAALLSHPNIVQIFELGTSNNSNFIVMEYIEGQSLRSIQKRLKSSRLVLNPLLSARIGCQVLRAHWRPERAK
jgi:serine/threonine-protein kinase